MIRRAQLWLPVIVVAGAIFLGSSGDWSLPVADTASTVLSKLVHLAEYAALAAMLARALTGEGMSIRLTRILAVLVAVAYGVTDEWHQGMVPGRSDSLIDLIPDALGAMAGALLFTVMRRRRGAITR